MSQLSYLRVYSGDDGKSHMETQTVHLRRTNYAPPAPVLNSSALEPASASLFLELPAGWWGDWHPTPVRQWIAILSGTCEFEVEDGTVSIQKKGDLIMLDDRHSKGHRSRVIGEIPLRMVAIHI
jgi:hypothetical protein